MAVCVLAGVLGLPLNTSAGTIEDCGYPNDGPGRFGPFNYNERGRLSAELSIVEKHHFTPYMEEVALHGFTLRRPETLEDRGEGGPLIAALDYTLYAFPNHHRALHAMAMLQLAMRERSISEYEKVMKNPRYRSAECYYERGLMMAPDDGVVYLGYGVLLHRLGKLDEAAERYRRAIELMPGSSEAYYNFGLLLFELGDHQRSAEMANKAYSLGFPLEGLRNRLSRVGITVKTGESALSSP